MTLKEFLEKHKNIVRWDDEFETIAGPAEEWVNHSLKRHAVKRRIFKKLADIGLLKEPFDYFEFGVFQGRTMLVASYIFDHPDTRLYGFDTFTGLPEDFYYEDTLISAKDSLSVGGKTPQETCVIQDARCSFFKGLVQDTLGGMLESYTNRRKLIFIDVDLYAGSWFILDHMAPLFLPGDVVLFDEFVFEREEYRAYCEYVEKYGDNLKLIGRNINQFVFVVEN